ncbi:hypothetical protein KKH43_03065 [Patescibacteria group bacterium]|nr:hypothetical protein [Patescibacteria group bacterium]
MERGYRPKSKEHLQAQVEAFADKGVEEYSFEQDDLFKYSAELAKIKDFNNLPKDLPDELLQLLEKNRQPYVDFIRKEKREEIEYRKENAEMYNKTFSLAIRKLKDTLASNPDFMNLPEYLGSGSNGDAFKIEIDGNEYVAKFPRFIMQHNLELKPLLRAQGIDHTAQLSAYSFEDGVIIMELLPGKDPSNFTKEEMPSYPDEHITQLIQTIQELDSKGVTIDSRPSNFLYDDDAGFSVLDFDHKSKEGYNLARQIMSLGLILSARKWPRLDFRADNYQEKLIERKLEEDTLMVPAVLKLLTTLKEKFPKILAQYHENRKAEEDNLQTSPILDRRYIQVDHPDIAPYLKKLEEFGL